ncbi:MULTISPECIES: hypothetical protein [Gluconobacter]|uniref:hypothetical protein n=1 Tax=Gluconobacter TaxID=441 RepID=UPI001B8AF7B1|nr:hypothetical protein [Gluconobacter albidus]MBS1029139.1 hypothetical protein [Gluconobacter albidus]
MSKALREIQEAHKTRPAQPHSKAVYQWLRKNQDIVSELREAKIATWEMIAKAARKDGVDVELSPVGLGAIRKMWSRLKSEREGITAGKPANDTPDQKPEPPSRTPADWRPAAVEEYYQEREERPSAPIPASPPLVPTTSTVATSMSSNDADPHTNISAEGRQSLEHIRAKLRARKEEKRRLTPD